MEQQLLEEKQRLVEKLGVVIEKNEQLAPVASRIISYVILTGKTGVTFDELVCKLGASKSTISTHLNHLLDLKKIEYFTKVGDRKKYFIISPCHILSHMDNMVSTWTAELQLHIEVKTFKEKVNATQTEDSKKFCLEFHNNYISFLDEATKSILTLKEKIINNSSITQ